MNAVNIPINKYYEGVIIPIMSSFYAKLEIDLSKFLLKSPEVIDPFDMTFKEYMKLDEERVRNLQLRTLREKEKWIEENIKNRGADWIVVCGGEVVKWSSDIEEYPTKDELKRIGKKYNRIPFVFFDLPLIEECGWSKTKHKDDYYPSVNVTINGKNRNLDIISDFDTGTRGVFLNLDELINYGIVNRLDSYDFPMKERHLKRDYVAYIKRVKISVGVEKGKTDSLEFKSYCVSNWQKSPFCLINPDRKALIGRSILFKFKLKIELDGKEKATKAYIST